MKRRMIALLGAIVLTAAVLTSDVARHDTVEENDAVASLLWLPMI